MYIKTIYYIIVLSMDPNLTLFNSATLTSNQSPTVMTIGITPWEKIVHHPISSLWIRRVITLKLLAAFLVFMPSNMYLPAQ